MQRAGNTAHTESIAVLRQTFNGVVRQSRTGRFAAAVAVVATLWPQPVQVGVTAAPLHGTHG